MPPRSSTIEEHMNRYHRALAALSLACAWHVHAAPAQAELVGPGTVSTAFHDFAASLTPDGGTLLFTRTDSGFTRMTLMQSSLKNGQWQTPAVLPFSGQWNDGDGVLSPDGKRYVYISNRPASGTQAKPDLDLWQVEKLANGAWGEPQRLPDAINSGVNEIYPSLASDGTLYFGRAGADNPLFRARLVNGVWQAPEALPVSGVSFAIAPDQSFAVLGMMDANRNLDLYRITREGDAWSKPSRLPASVNTPLMEFASSITPDGRSLLFASTRRDGSVGWPRAQPVTSAAEVAAELNGAVANGLRNIYAIPVSALKE
jgi:hypothetical protein